MSEHEEADLHNLPRYLHTAGVLAKVQSTKKARLQFEGTAQMLAEVSCHHTCSYSLRLPFL